MQPLSGDQYGALMNALLSAFPTRARLEEMVLIKCEKPLDQLTLGGNLRQVVLELIKAAESEGWTAQLVAGGRESNPGNALLADIAAKLHLAVAAPPRPELQLMIDRDDGMLNPVSWRERLARLETQVCQLSYPLKGATARGTGFLVGPDVVMTNHHVVKPLLEEEGDPATVRARFDFKTLADGTTVHDGAFVELASEWCLDSSPASRLDEIAETGTDLPKTTELDYALLRLAEPVGTSPIGAKPDPSAPPRGWIDRSGNRLHPDGMIFILQHPERSPLQLAMNTVICVNANGTRVRYRTNTESGSSGSPCFDISLNLVALHHSGDPSYMKTKHAGYNQGIPLDPILTLLEERQHRDKVLTAA